MNKLQAKRVLKWADHIEKGKLGHDEFDMSVVHETNNCTIAGCAMGELPFVFPEIFEFDKDRVIRISDRLSGFGFLDMHFGISATEAPCLFGTSVFTRKVDWECDELFPLSVLSKSDTRKAIAGSMRRFVAWKIKQNKRS